MRDLQGSALAKAVAAVFLAVFLGSGTLTAVGSLLLLNGYGTADTFSQDPSCVSMMQGGMYYALDMATADENDYAYYYAQDQLDTLYAGLLYSVYAGDPADGELVATNMEEGRSYAFLTDEQRLTLAAAGQPLVETDSAAPTESVGPTEDIVTDYTVVARLDASLPQYSGFAFYLAVYSVLHAMGGAAGILPVLSVLLLCAALAALVFLLSAAGHRRDEPGIVAGWQERIPLDLYLAIAGLLFFALACLVAVAFDTFARRVNLLMVSWPVCAVLLLVFALLVVLMSLATRIKLGKWWRNSLCYFLFRWLRRLWRRFTAGVRSAAEALPLTWRTVTAVALALFFQLCLSLLSFLSYANNGMFFLILLALDICILTAAARLSLQAQKLRDKGRALAEGDLESRVDTQGMYKDLREHGENLNAIGQGLNRAVEQRMRSERLKTELITNVSHDIKTPLTSIINYVDLLKKEELPETASEYLAVLDRQANRLKKLTEDLVEASKASTGNVAVDLSPILVNEIVHQAIGDYSEKLTAGKLEVIVNTYEGNLEAMADGRLLWRVLDNLLNNVCKYALAGTRVYVDLTGREGWVDLSIKNISRDPLNIGAEDLMERFVRGDASRHTEGSGLGLNIAKSLMDLMGGDFSLSVDGDLFKARLSLPTAEGARARQLEPAPQDDHPAEEAEAARHTGPLESLRRFLGR